MSKQKTNSINKETDICDIGLSTRSYNALTQAGIEKVGDIICKDILQIKEIRNIGKKSFSNIETIIHDCGFLFKGEKANSDLAKLGLKVGTYNSLVYSEITEIAQLIEYEECELLKLPGVGKVAIKDIKEKLSEVGLKLKEKEIMDEDLSILNLSNKSRNVLVHNQIMKIKQVFGHTLQAFYNEDYSIRYGDVIEFMNNKMLDNCKAYVLDTETFTIEKI